MLVSPTLRDTISYPHFPLNALDDELSNELMTQFPYKTFSEIGSQDISNFFESNHPYYPAVVRYGIRLQEIEQQTYIRRSETIEQLYSKLKRI